MLARLILSFALLLSPAFASAQQFPPLSGRVVDAADLLDPAQEAELTQLSEGIEAASSRQFVVATIPSLEDYPIEDYGYRLGRAWGIGQEGADNGVILLVAPSERKVRIEVGYGLEPVMTDALSSVIVNQTILPAFRDGDMGGGIVAGAQAIGEQLRLPLEEAEQRAQTVVAERQRNRGGGGGLAIGAAIFWVIVLVVILIALAANRPKGKRYRGRRGGGPVILWGPGLGSGWGSGGGSSWGGGGGGFGGFSGGGGSFGGGGASGGW